MGSLEQSSWPDDDSIAASQEGFGLNHQQRASHRMVTGARSKRDNLSFVDDMQSGTNLRNGFVLLKD
jgi:hypothetical protein